MHVRREGIHEENRVLSGEDWLLLLLLLGDLGCNMKLGGSCP